MKNTESKPVSDCCGAEAKGNSQDCGICPDCKEHCEYETQPENSFYLQIAEFLPKEYAAKFRSNVIKQESANRMPLTATVSDLIYHAFFWWNTPEGQTFWSNIAHGEYEQNTTIGQMIEDRQWKSRKYRKPLLKLLMGRL